MQPDYNQLWNNLNKDSQINDAHFYAFFEDSLNQFISANSDSSQLTANQYTEQFIDNKNSDKQKLISVV